MKFVNTSANTPLIEDRRIYATGEVAARLAAEKIRNVNFQVLYCHQCVAGPEWSSGGRAESDYLHHINLVTEGNAECFFGADTIRMRPGHVYFFPGNTPLRRECRRRFVSYLLAFRCEWFPGIDFLLDWPDRRPLCLGRFDEREWRERLTVHPETALNAMLHVQSSVGIWMAAACPTLDAVITRHIECHARFSGVFDHVERNLDARLRVSHLARVFGASIHAFSISFSRTVGLSPKEFIDRQLNERLITRLITTDDTLQRIALDWGFTDQSNLADTSSDSTASRPPNSAAPFSPAATPSWASHAGVEKWHASEHL